MSEPDSYRYYWEVPTVTETVWECSFEDLPNDPGALAETINGALAKVPEACRTTASISAEDLDYFDRPTGLRMTYERAKTEEERVADERARLHHEREDRARKVSHDAYLAAMSTPSQQEGNQG
jgi:hypothetical protein